MDVLQKPCLKICTALSARPLDDGWYGATRRCFTPLRWQNWQNSSAAKWGPLSDTTDSGMPNLANSWRRCCMVSSAVAVVISFAVSITVRAKSSYFFPPLGGLAVESTDCHPWDWHSGISFSHLQRVSQWKSHAYQYDHYLSHMQSILSHNIRNSGHQKDKCISISWLESCLGDRRSTL